jgi:redox-sensitive bicupin YhaK (pirin superfamily)
MKTTILKAAQRGTMRHPQLTGHLLFSNGAKDTGRPDVFGAVYVFNDDYMGPGAYAGLHPHANVEIITVMVAGRESHADNLAYQQELGVGAVQLISAGMGIEHAGGNVSKSEDAHHLQIWVAPRSHNTVPAVQLKPAPASAPRNVWQCAVSPDGRQGSLRINQDTWLMQGTFEPGPLSYAMQKADQGLLLYVLAGRLRVGEIAASQGDTLFITEADQLAAVVEEAATLVLLETIMP